MNLEEMAEAFGFEENELVEMLELFIETTEADLTRLGLALERRDSRAAMEAAHSIKGAARNFGFDGLSRCAESIEHDVRQNDLSGSGQTVEAIKDQLNKIVAGLRNH